MENGSVWNIKVHIYSRDKLIIQNGPVAWFVSDQNTTEVCVPFSSPIFQSNNKYDKTAVLTWFFWPQPY